MSANVMEAIPHTEVDAARAQFDEAGYVCLSGLYDAALAEQAIAEAYHIAGSGYKRPSGERIHQFALPTKTGSPALHGLIEGMQTGAYALGRDITMPFPGTKPEALMIDMAARSEGAMHYDKGLSEAVAITTARGESELLISGATHVLEPGVTLIHDADRKLPHQGLNPSDANRIGFTIIRRQTAPTHQSIEDRSASRAA